MFKKSVLSVISGLTILAGTTATVFAQPTPNVSTVTTPDSVSEQQVQKRITFSSQTDNEMIRIGEAAKQYLVINSNGTVSVNATADQLGTTQNELNKYNQMIDAINAEILAGNISVDKNGNLVAPQQKKNTITPEWDYSANFYGTTFVLTELDTQHFEGALNEWAAAGAGVTTIAGWLASKGIPYAAAAGLATGLVSAGLWWVAADLQRHDNGNGVTIYISNWNPGRAFEVTPN